MGEWHNGGIARKTIARGMVMTIGEDNLEGMHARKRCFNQAR